MKKVRFFCGFAVTTIRANFHSVLSKAFFDTMHSAGCVLGFFTDCSPCRTTPQEDWTIPQEMREEFRKQVMKLRKNDFTIIAQFPHEEYGEENICSESGRGLFHMNSRGEAEPCPFSPYSCDNIRNGGLRTACNSLFLQTIRNRPELLKRRREACALFEHQGEIENLHIQILAQGKEKKNEHF